MNIVKIPVKLNTVFHVVLLTLKFERSTEHQNYLLSTWKLHLDFH